MRQDDKTYFRRRAEEEIARAQSSRDERLVSFHYHLAGLYLDLVHGQESRAPGDSGGTQKSDPGAAI
jgi:hypothetical protein